LLGHEAIELHHFPSSWRVTGFLLNWMLMAVAMSVAGSLACVHSFDPASCQRMKNKWLTILTILGYLLPWAFFGLLAYLGDNILHQMAEPGALLAALLISPAILMVAGLYQLTPTKRGYLRRCRPGSLRPSRQRRETNGAGIFRRGAAAGDFLPGELLGVDAGNVCPGS
jgi:predicted metal-binding membrane protein